MGLVVGTAQPVQGFGPILALDVKKVREIYAHFEEVCPTPTLWERAFYELLDCFDSPEACSKAFLVLDSDKDGFVDARETFGALAILCKGHLSERLQLLFDMFDLNKENDMGFDEAFLMLRRTSNGLRKITGLVAPPEQVIQLMVQQIWKYAKKHRDVRIRQEDWQAWWERDSTCRRALQAFVVRPEDQRGLPTPDKWLNVDYAKDAASGTDEEPGSVSLLAPSRSIIAERKAALDGGAAARQGKSPSPEMTGVRPASCTPVVDYEELVRDGQTDSPFLIAEKDALDANKALMIAQ